MICCPNSFDISLSGLNLEKRYSNWRKWRVYRKVHRCIEWKTLLSYGIGLWAALCAINVNEANVGNTINADVTTSSVSSITNESSYFAAAGNRENRWDCWNVRMIGISIEASAITCLLFLITYLQRYPGKKSVQAVHRISAATKLHEHLSSTIDRLKEHVELKTDAQFDHYRYSCKDATKIACAIEDSTFKKSNTSVVTCVTSASNDEIADMPEDDADAIRIDRIVGQSMPSNDIRTMRRRIISSSTAFQKFLLNLPKVRQSCPCYT